MRWRPTATPTSGQLHAAAGAGIDHQHDYGAAQYVLRTKSSHWGEGGRTRLSGAAGGMARTAQDGDDAPPYRAGPPPGPIPSRDRLARAQARGLSTVPVSRCILSVPYLSHGLRPPAKGSAYGTGRRQGLSTHSTSGGLPQRGAGRGGVAVTSLEHSEPIDPEAVAARMAAPARNPAELVAVEAANLGRYNDLLAGLSERRRTALRYLGP